MECDVLFLLGIPWLTFQVSRPLWQQLRRACRDRGLGFHCTPGRAQFVSISQLREARLSGLVLTVHWTLSELRSPQGSLEQEVLGSHQMFHVTTHPSSFNPFSGSHQSPWQGGGGTWSCNRHESSIQPPSGQHTWLKHGLSALGTQAGLHSSPHNGRAWGEGPLWGQARQDHPKITQGAREEPRKGCLATEMPRP